MGFFLKALMFRTQFSGDKIVVNQNRRCRVSLEYSCYVLLPGSTGRAKLPCGWFCFIVQVVSRLFSSEGTRSSTEVPNNSWRKMNPKKWGGGGRETGWGGAGNDGFLLLLFFSYGTSPPPPHLSRAST